MGQIGELVAQHRQHLSDAQPPSAGPAGPARRRGPPASGPSLGGGVRWPGPSDLPVLSVLAAHPLRPPLSGVGAVGRTEEDTAGLPSPPPRRSSDLPGTSSPSMASTCPRPARLRPGELGLRAAEAAMPQPFPWKG